MKVSKEGTSLRVESGGRVLRLSEEEGEMKWRRRLGPIPAWCLSAVSAFVSVVFIAYALGRPFTGASAVGLWFALLNALSEFESRAAFQRLEDRLVDRTYDLSKYAPAELRP